jgi:hypothetical protein
MRYQGIRNTGSFLAPITLMLATAVHAEEPKSTPVTPRQIAHCLVQRIHEDRRGERSESYKDALKACRQDAADADRNTTTAMNSANDTEASK